MNFSGISNRSVLGQLLRMPLKLLPSHLKVPILQGKLRGKQWIVGSSQHGCWLGSYEYDKQRLFEEYITPGSVVFDLGAHVGFYTLLASVLGGPQGKVFAFEPMPQNLVYLKEHLRLNHMANVTVIEAAVSDREGIAYFELNDCSFQGHLAKQGDLKVRTVGLDHLLKDEVIPVPNYLKIDVEGAEVQVLNGARSILEHHHPTIFLATHGDDVHDQCCRILTGLGYELRPIGDKPLKDSDEILAVHSSRI